MNRYCLLSLVLLSACLTCSAVNVDSLMLQYEQKSSILQPKTGQELIAFFSQDNYYDSPVSNKLLNDNKLNAMLVYLGMATYTYDYSRFKEAKTYATKALSYIPKDSLRWLASCYGILNVATQRLGDFNSALNYANKSLSIGQKLHDESIMSSALNNLATINLSTEHYDEALHFIDQAIDIERNNPNDDLALAIRLGIKCEILMCMHRPDEALACIDEALERDRKAQRNKKVPIRLSQKADILLELQQWSECRKICLEALQAFDNMGSDIDKIITLKQLGMCEMGANHDDKAESYLLEGLRISENIGSKPLQWRIQHQLYLLYKKTHNLEKAIEHLEQCHAIKDTINNEKYQALLSEYQVVYETQEKEKQLEDQDRVLKNRLRLLILLFFLLALLASLTLVSLRLARTRKKNNERLSQLNKTRNQIFSVVSHDLKNPVQAQKQVLHYICDHYDQISDADKQRQIAELKKSNDFLSDLLYNLLDWASLETGRLVYKPIRADLSSLTKDIIRKIQPFANIKNVTITANIPFGTFVMADMRYFESILYNLLHNAIKFSFEKGVVEVESEEKDNMIFLKVTDHGVGIKPEEQDQILYQEMISKAGTSGESGTGIGLMICKELIERSNSQLSVSSKPLHYTTFAFTLPKA